MITRQTKPLWLKTRLLAGSDVLKLKKEISERNLHTVCQSARCPNIYECWTKSHATFLIMGSVCTRHCLFCSIAKGVPAELDHDEDRKILELIDRLKVRFAVLTSVSRDDLEDKGSGHFAKIIGFLKKQRPELKIEVLIPDFDGQSDHLDRILMSGPDVVAHNLETVRFLYPDINRTINQYNRSLMVLRYIRQKDFLCKSGIMVGLGEKPEDITVTLQDLKNAGVDILTIGQYLQPTSSQLPVLKYYTPAEFAGLKKMALEIGFRAVEAGPLVRSSYHSGDLYWAIQHEISNIQ